MRTQRFFRPKGRSESPMRLEDGSKIAVIGGGPAGSFFAYFLLDLADRYGVDLRVDVYEPRDFSLPAPLGCNMCAGVISETLVQNLATEGINLPTSIIQKSFDSYVLHTDVGNQRLAAPSHEKRIGAAFRGGGPHGIQEVKVIGFDAHMLSIAKNKGANIIRSRVSGVERVGERLQVKTRGSDNEGYDLLVVAAGVNTAVLKLFEQDNSRYVSPKTTKTAIRDYHLGSQAVDTHFGGSLHVFLLGIPKLDFAMIVPKGEYVSVCMLGNDIDDGLLQAFLTAPEVKSCFPDDWRWDKPDCQCLPRINTRAAEKPYADRLVFIGDSGVSRLKKDGIGAAYRSAKAAASCAILEGVASEDFQRYYLPFYKSIELDNDFGRFIYFVTRISQRVRFIRRAMLRTVSAEQSSPGISPRMSNVLWDTFTGSAPYLDVFWRILRPAFMFRFAWDLVVSAMGG